MGDNFSSKLKDAIDICTYGYINNSFKLLYPFTTENIAGYLPSFDLNDKSLFTVGSSCDQVFNAILYGSRDITVFDICPYVKEYYYLKKAAIECFSREEFLSFLCYKHYPNTFDDNDSAFSKDLYLSLRNKIKDDDYESYLFWDRLFTEFDGLTIRREMFNHDEYNREIKCRVNKYLSDDLMFEKLKGMINNSKVSFSTGDIFDTKIQGEYDNILLSNLCAFYSKEKIMELFYKMVLSLKDNGRLLACYMYYLFIKSGYYKELLENFGESSYNLEFNSFIGTRGIQFSDDSMEDMAVVYKKVLKKI